MTAVSDDFNRANSSNLGASWTEVVGDWEIVSSRVQVNTDGGATGYYARYETDTGSSDMFSQAVTTASQADGASSSGVAVRMRAAANTSYQLTTRHAGDTIGNWRIVAGSETQLSFQTGATSISTTIASGDTVRLEVVGSLLRSKVQSALVGLTLDTNVTDGQRAGLNGYNNVGTDVVELDDFAGGGLAADGGLLAPYIVGISAQVTGTGTTLTPTVPANVATGDLVVAHCTSRDAAQTMTAPGSQGWDAGPTPSQTGLEDAVFYKVWGAGATDDTTPTFSIGSGTAGWGVTVTVFRNPSHGSAPWTSTSVAVVASGSAANASSATVTAPSVNHDGTHRTVVRLFSSADDNALGAPSDGALAYGAAAYDQTTGNDYSQAMSLREDITVTTNTGTSTVTETVLGNDVNNAVTLVLAIPSSTNGTATPAVIAATTTLPAPSVVGVSQAQPAAIAGTTTIPAPSASGAATATPAAILAPSSLPAPTVIGQTLVQPAAITTTTTLPTPSTTTGAGPAAITSSVALPAPVVAGSAAAAPATIAVQITIPPASAEAPAATQPATIVAAFTIPTPTVTVSGTAQPVAVEAVADLPAPGLSSGVTPATIAAVAAVPTPSVSEGGSVSVTPSTIQSIVSILAPSLTVAAGPAVIAAPTTLPAPGVTAGTGATATPATIAALITLPPATATGETPGAAAPATIALVALLPAPTVTGGTGPELVGRVVSISRARTTAATTPNTRRLVDQEVTTS